MLDKLSTEKRNENTMKIDEFSAKEICEVMNHEDSKVSLAVYEELDSISVAIEMVKECLLSNGRLVYCGAGTSGRIGSIDAVECPPTFSYDPSKIIGLLAGSLSNQLGKEEAEDFPLLALKELKELNLGANDILIGLSASGRTPYVRGALEYASKVNAKTIVVCCNKNSLLSPLANHFIEVDCGPEVITGSTRLKAGTAQKMIVNMISTGAMILLGRVYENLMVDVDASNEKLVERWKKMVIEATSCSYTRASELFTSSSGKAKVAITMEKLQVSYHDAISLLDSSENNLKAVINRNR